MKDASVYLDHIFECLDHIEEYCRDGRRAFFDSTLIQDAVLRRLQTLAETTKRLPESLKDEHPSVPWRAVAGFRNVVVHDYLGIDIGQIWEVVETDLPSLRRDLERIRTSLRRA